MPPGFRGIIRRTSSTRTPEAGRCRNGSSLLTAALGEIRKNHDMFLRGPVFTGFVKGIETGGERIITVQIKYECAESDSSRAENCISREIISFCEREEIGIV